MSCAAAEVIVNPLAKYVFKTPRKTARRDVDLQYDEGQGDHEDRGSQRQ